MIPASFDYLRAGSVSEAITMLSDHGDDAKLLAGGHSLLPLMKFRLATPAVLVDIGHLRELSFVRDEGGHVAIGALTRHHDIANSPEVRAAAPVLAHVAGQVGDPQVRHRGTIGGSIAHGDSASDLPAVVLALGGSLIAEGPSGRREIAAQDFHLSFFEVSLEPDEILVEVRVPRAPGDRWGFEKLTKPRAGLGDRRRGSSPNCERCRGRPRQHGAGPVASGGGGVSGGIGCKRRRGGTIGRREYGARGGLQRVGRVPPTRGTGAGAPGPRASRRLIDNTPSLALGSPEELSLVLAQHDYLADDSLATVLFLALRLGRPLFLEGEAGVGKTEVAKVLARWTGGELLRLQCYDGIDVSQAVYEWDYARQLLHLRAAEATSAGSDQASELERSLYSEAYLVRRPLLKAIAGSADGPVPVLLIDEIDRADDEFEAYLLEILSDFTISVPELGTFRAERPPVVIVTSNRTRDVHDALKRRCLYHWVDHPSFEREVAIVRLHVPEATESIAREVAAAAAVLRRQGLYKPPGVAETIDWAQALDALGSARLDERTVERTLGTILKYREDAERVRAAGLTNLLTEAREVGA